MWNGSYQRIFEWAKDIIKEDTYMNFHSKLRPLYLETDTIGIGLGTELLQTRGDTRYPQDAAQDNSTWKLFAFTSKSLTSSERWHTNIEREVIRTMHWLEKLHHYYFARKVSIIIDYNQLVAIFKKDVTTLLQRYQQILWRIHQYRVKIQYNHRPELVIANWLYHQNHKDDWDSKIPDIQINAMSITVDYWNVYQ